MALNQSVPPPAPDSGQKWAIAHANKGVDDQVPYDSSFEPSGGRYDCHKFTAFCYPELEIVSVSA